MAVQPSSVLDMASLWLCCLLISVISITSHPSAADVPEPDSGVQLPGNDTGCGGDPHGDRLQGLCDEQGMSCCLFTDPGGDCGQGLCLDVEGGRREVNWGSTSTAAGR